MSTSKNAKQPHLTARPSNAAPRQNLPAWYYRLVALTIKEDREVSPEDFDEDLSDLEETNAKDEEGNNAMGAGCDCDCDSEDSECDCGSLDYDTDDSLAERSYDGSDADYYYELKYEREERKRELRDMREHEQKAKETRRDFESEMEKEVQEAYECLQRAEMKGDAHRHDLLGKVFHLYSVDHVDLCYSDFYPSKYVEFHCLDDNGAQLCCDQLLDDEARQIDGHVYFNVNCGCDFASFSPPKRAGQEEHRLKSFDGEYELVFRFISNDYLIMTVSRELVLMDRSPVPSAPEMFKFMGIRYDQEKEKQRRNAKRKRSPSPRES
ncbi:hypothetical protein B0T10DRAFT_499916 [Thelonectria olida]|uniref:Uncharacterized protein n=1 Tax=Thelonectria olida TaxID=1576542 RepID=A0A9P9AKT6_9HYPO|nr:hypothetical protein B0T10DRAFT_499916 [Thelonectria olida]